MMSLLHRDLYYRGYRLSILREGTPTQQVNIRHMGDPDLIAAVPDVDRAKKTIDEWMDAP